MIKKLVAPFLIGAFVLVGSHSAFAYTVKPGDTMGEIASTHGMTLNELASLNSNISNINLIYVGDTIQTNKNETRTVSKAVETKQTVSSSNDAYLLAQLVEAEARGESYIGKVAVAEIVLNRMHSNQFPDTIRGVIYQSGQFSPVSNGTINNSPSKDSISAAEQALAGSNYTNGGLYFYNPGIVSSWLGTKATTAVIGNHTFKK